jgi:hypothetical protein
MGDLLANVVTSVDKSSGNVNVRRRAIPGPATITV